MASVVQSGEDGEEENTEKRKGRSYQRAKWKHQVIACDDSISPQTLPEYIQAKGYLSVTDLVSPSWCEYAYYYGILGKRHLPVSQRPKEIATPSGNVIKPDKEVAQVREKVLVRGRKVHEKLEKEIHPEKVEIRTATREDAWALRFLRLIVSLQNLLQTGCSREIPIFGFVHGQLVMGVIDEINRRPLSKRLNGYLDQEQSEHAPESKPLSDFFTPLVQPQLPLSTEKEEEAVKNNILNGTKRWSSQEEWKNERRRKEAGSKLMKKSPKKATAKNGRKRKLEQGQPNLLNFFGGGASSRSVQMDESVPQERFGYFLEDSKTRKARLIPPVEDQQSARLQCMLYKRLFDGLILGMVDGIPSPQGSNKQSDVLEMDENATPIEPIGLFNFLDLDHDRLLSKRFIDDAESLLHGYGVRLPQVQDYDCTLITLSDLLGQTLKDLTRSARRGLGWIESDSAISGAIQHHLRLTYRKVKGRYVRTMKGYESMSRRKQPSRYAKGASNGTEQNQSKEKDQEESTILQAGTEEDSSIAAALQLGITEDMQQAAIEEEILRDNGVIIPDSSPSLPQSQRDKTDGEEQIEEAEADPNILGKVDFFHNSYRLENHLQDMMNLWKGEREMKGVTIEQSWRCHQCEFRMDCEWREQKGQQDLESVMLRRKVDQIAQAVDQQPIGASDLNGTNSNDDMQMKEIEQQQETQEDCTMESQQQQQNIVKQDLDDEDALWSQFEEIASDDLKE